MEMKINSDLVKQFRLQKSWSQERLAEAAGLSLRTVQRIETDGAVSLQSRSAIADALGVEPSALDAESSLTSHKDNAAESPQFSLLSQRNRDLWTSYLRPGLRIGAIAIAWAGIAFSAFLIFVILVGGIFYWEATPLSFWQSVGGALMGAAVFVPVLVCFYYLYRYLKRPPRAQAPVR